jgi:ketosteroid isomerase-like protein
MSNLFLSLKGGVNMKKLFMVIPLVFLLCFTFSCQQQVEEVAEEPVVDVEADVEALKSMNDEWVVLYNAGEIEKLVSFYYAEDAVEMEANLPIHEGREAILASYKKTLEKYDRQCDSSIAKDVRVSGNMAIVRGNDTGTRTLKDGGEPIKYDAKWVGIFERQPDGTWKCICEIGNSNLPLPESPEQE